MLRRQQKHDRRHRRPGTRFTGPGRAQALVLLLALLFLSGPVSAQEKESAGGPAAGERPAMPVEAARAEVTSVTRKITAVGTLRANESVVITAEIPGRVAEIAFREGQRTGKGDVLVRLDSTVLRAQRDRAEAGLILSRANRERAELLFDQAAISQRERDEAMAQWRLDEAALRLAEAQLEKTVLRAPFRGVLGLRHVSVGEYVQPGQPIVTLDDPDPIKVDFRVPEVYSTRLETGQMVQVTIDAAPGTTFSGAVYAVDPSVDPESRSLPVRARVPNSDGILKPGMFAQIQLVMEEKPDALMIPEEALLSRGMEKYVYRIVDGVVVQTPVVSGLRQPGRVEILDGLSAGDTVITAGQIKVRPGMAVTVVPAAGKN